LKCGTNGLSRGALLNAPRRVLILFLFFVSIHSLPSIRYFPFLSLFHFVSFGSYLRWANLIAAELCLLYSLHSSPFSATGKKRVAFQKSWAVRELRHSNGTCMPPKGRRTPAARCSREEKRRKIKADEGYYTQQSVWGNTCTTLL